MTDQRIEPARKREWMEIARRIEAKRHVTDLTEAIDRDLREGAPKRLIPLAHLLHPK